MFEYQLTTLSLEEFTKTYKLKHDIITESDSQRFSNYFIYPSDSKMYSDKGLTNKDNGSQCDTHWRCFIMEDGKSNYFDSFGIQPNKFLLIQKPKPIVYHKYE